MAAIERGWLPQARLAYVRFFFYGDILDHIQSPCDLDCVDHDVIEVAWLCSVMPLMLLVSPTHRACCLSTYNDCTVPVACTSNVVKESAELMYSSPTSHCIFSIHMHLMFYEAFLYFAGFVNKVKI